MNSLEKKIELHFYSKNQLSAKDIEKDVNIDDSKWDQLFTYLFNEMSFFYFLGERIEDINNRTLRENLYFVSDRIVYNDGFYNILLVIKSANVSINRNLLSQIWCGYEYPAIIFTKDNSNEGLLVELCARNSSYDEITNALAQCCIIYKSFEPNVLWLKKSGDIEFPTI